MTIRHTVEIDLIDVPLFENISQLADFIDELPDCEEAVCGFDMNVDSEGAFVTEHPCGTACCIGGWVQISMLKHGRTDLSYKGAATILRDAFSIPMRDAERIAFPGASGERGEPDGWDASEWQAAEMLRHYVKTGTVDWDRVMCMSERPKAAA